MQSAMGIGDYGFCWGLVEDSFFLQTEILFGSITPSTLIFLLFFWQLQQIKMTQPTKPASQRWCKNSNIELSFESHDMLICLLDPKAKCNLTKQMTVFVDRVQYRDLATKKESRGKYQPRS